MFEGYEDHRIARLAEQYVRRKELLFRYKPAVRQRPIGQFEKAVARAEWRRRGFRPRIVWPDWNWLSSIKDVCAGWFRWPNGGEWGWAKVTSAAVASLFVGLAGLHTAAPVAFERAAAPLIAAIPWPRVTAIEEAMVCLQAIPVIDSEGRNLGAIRRPGCRPSDNMLMTSAIASEDVAKIRVDAIEVLEGEIAPNRKTLFGVDLTGLPRIVKYGARVGSSSPIVSATESIAGQPRGGASSIWFVRQGLRIIRKIDSYAASAVFTARHLPRMEDRIRFVLENTPCVRGASKSRFGAPLAGRLCARFLFGKGFARLSAAERCLHAASFLHQFRFVGPQTPYKARLRAEKVLAKIKKRAMICAERLASRQEWSELKLSATKRQISNYTVPTWRPDEFHDPRVSLLRRRLPGLTILLKDELKLFGQKAGLVPGAGLQLSVSARQQRVFHSRLTKTLAGLSSRINPALCIMDCRNGQERADVAAGIFEVSGDQLWLRAGYSNRHYLMTGPLRKEGGRYVLGPAHRSLGSLQKPWIAILAHMKGKRRLCNRAFGGIQNPNGGKGVPRCGARRGWVTVSAALARSMNLPFINFLRSVPRYEAESYFKRLGFSIAPDATGVHFVTGSVLGNKVTAAPILVVRDWAALLKGILGESPVAVLPAANLGADRVLPVNLADAGIKDLPRLRRLLGAPIGRHGTLRKLAPVLRRAGCRTAIGKTGTSEGSGTATAVRDKVVIAAFQCGKRKYVAFAMVGSPSMTVPLGGIETDTIVQIIAGLVHAVTRAKM